MTKLSELSVLIELQTNDLGLWGIPQSPEEEYLQMALRELHLAVLKCIALDKEPDVEAEP